MRALLRTGAVAVVGAGIVAAAVHYPDRGWITVDAAAPAPAASRAAVPVTTSALICPGPETVGVKKVDAKTAATPTSVRVGAAPRDLAPAGAGTGIVTATGLGGPGALAFSPLQAPGAASLHVATARSILFSGKGSVAPGLSAAQTTLVASGDLRGLAGTACTAPAAQSWLVGAGGTTGRRDRVVLANPTSAAVTVDLEVSGADGPVSAPAGRGIVVPAHQRKVVLLDAIAPAETAPVIHVVASGGVIGATLFDSWLDGTTPAGIDDVPASQPGTRLVVPGVVASGVPHSALLRVAATAREAVVQLRALGQQGPSAVPGLKDGVLRVPAGTVKDVDLSGLLAGTYAVQITSDEPVVAAAEFGAASAAGGARDLAWSVARPALSGLAGVPLGPVAAPWASSLAVAAVADSTAELVTVAADGTESTRTLTVAGGTTQVVPLTTAAASLWLRPRTGGVQAALVTSYADPAGALLSVTPLAAAVLSARPVVVRQLAG